MKLIALKDFRNNADLEVDGQKHVHHVHKGARFSIGRADELKDLSAAERMLVAQLTVSGCVGDPTGEAGEKLCKKVDAEVKQDKVREENAAKLDRQADASKLVLQLTELLQKANAAVTPAPAK